MNRLHQLLVSAVAMTLVGLTGLPQAEAGESLPIREGSTVTLLYQITVPGDEQFEVRDLSQFVQGRHQMLPALERADHMILERKLSFQRTNCRKAQSPAMSWRTSLVVALPSPRCLGGERSWISIIPWQANHS